LLNLYCNDARMAASLGVVLWSGAVKDFPSPDDKKRVVAISIKPNLLSWTETVSACVRLCAAAGGERICAWTLNDDYPDGDLYRRAACVQVVGREP